MVAKSVSAKLAARWSQVSVGTMVLGVVSACTVLMASTGVHTAVATDLSYQCDTVVGPDPSISSTAPNSVKAASVVADAVTVAPTVNPYAESASSEDDSAWMKACHAALRTAPFQLQPLDRPVTGPAVDCARITAVALEDMAISAGDGRAADPAQVLRLVIRRASTAAVTGVCSPVQAGDLAAEQGHASAPTDARQCPSPTATVIELPATVAAQSLCNRRVDLAAVSAGDLVFWQYDNFVPVRAGVSVGASQMVTVDVTTGRVVQTALPAGRDVRVKRLLNTPA